MRFFQNPQALVCPTCGSAHQGSFCPVCNMPLIPPGEITARVSERHRRARKVKPQLAAGEPVRVARARNQAEAELIADLLLDEGVPSLVRRSAGFDVPDFLAAGPRDVLVPQAGEAVARELLEAAGLASGQPESARVAPGRLLAGLLLALAIGAIVIWVLLQLAR